MGAPCTTALVLAALFTAYALAAVALLSLSTSAAQPPAEKIGAGFLLCSQGKVLLLKRDSNHNDNTWTVPGGNKEATDSSLLATATRETREELGSVPPLEVKAQILTKRGKRQQKHFTIFVSDVTQGVATNFAPKLSDESKGWRWVPWSDVRASAAAEDSDDDYGDPGDASSFVVHPIVTRLVRDHEREVARASRACGAAAA